MTTTPKGIPLPPDSTKISAIAESMRDMAAATDAAIDDMAPDAAQAAADAATEAVDAQLATAGLLKDADPRLPKVNPESVFRVRDKSGVVALSVDATGATTVGTTSHKPLQVSTGWAHTITDKNGSIAFGIRNDGTVYFGGQSPDGTPIREVHIIVGGGQSNMSGRGTPVGADFDPEDSRVFQFGSGASAITPATVPLDMHDTSTGLSPLTVFAREYLRTQPPGIVVVLVPAAHGGTGFTTTGENPPPTGYTYVAGGGCWQVTDVGPVNLYEAMLAQTQQAITQATAFFGMAPKLKALLWHQGEADSARLTESQYATYFDALVNDFRTQLSAPALPVVVGEMSPDWTVRNVVAAGVMAAHIQTAARFQNAGFAYGPANTGKHGDDVHYSRVGVERLGKAMHEAYRRALLNVTGNPAPPPSVSATRTGGTVEIRWEQAPSRVTGYTVEYQIDGGTWTAAPAPSPALNTKTTVTGITGNKVLVRVATVNATATSATTQPTTAIGA
ncbi:sialate O-acetylesterase [Paenarthrobacter sp. YIM B13468]|uniref:sialate O-acetylesterase n=1 Tax=Paenarthrobacter sp. YIM B13468 TaxID=3366295 RepID=UPI0036724FC7